MVKRGNLRYCQNQADRRKGWEGRVRSWLASLGSGHCRCHVETQVLRGLASAHCCLPYQLRY